MAYTKTVWNYVGTPLNPSNLNKMEEGIYQANVTADAAYPNPTGNSVFLGKYAGTAASTPYYNVGIGYQSLYSATSGSQYNVGIGHKTLYSATTALQNVAIGSSALQQVTTADYNTAIGTASLQFGNGSNNVAVGKYAGLYCADGSTPNTGSANCVLLGTDTKVNSVSSSNEIVIGYNAIGNGDNTATIGNASISNLYVYDKLVYHAGNLSNSKVNLYNASGIKGTGTGASNQAYFSFYENDGTTRQGYIGYGDSAGTLFIWNDLSTDVYIKTSGAGKAKINGHEILTTNNALSKVSVPDTAASTGIAGQVAYDSNYFYVCYATNSWARYAKSTW